MTNADPMLALDLGPLRGQPAGVGLYVARLAGGLAQLMPERMALIGVRPDAATLDIPAVAVASQPFRTPTYHAWIQLAADRDARSTSAQLVHYTNAAAPLLSRLPYVVTVHDLSVARLPRSHPWTRWSILPLNMVAIARARAIIVPSRWTARELRHIGVDGRRIVVIPHAPTMAPAVGSAAALLARIGLRADQYVVYVGTLEPRKNIERLVEAFERVARQRPELMLVLAGAPGWHYAAIARRIARSAVRERIILTGYLAADDIAALVAASTVMAYVSLYEGFGMPVLDALALGAAVVTSDRTAMPEAAGSAAVLVDPTDTGAIARGLDEAITRRTELRQWVRDRPPRRTWTDVAREHLDVYRRAHRG